MFPVLFKELLEVVHYFKPASVFFKIPTGSIYPTQIIVTSQFSVHTERPDLAHVTHIYRYIYMYIYTNKLRLENRGLWTT